MAKRQSPGLQSRLVRLAGQLAQLFDSFIMPQVRAGRAAGRNSKILAKSAKAWKPLATDSCAHTAAVPGFTPPLMRRY